MEKEINKTAIDYLLKSFTSNDEYRREMKTPSLIGEYVYATNGHCLIKVPVSYLSGQYSEIPKFPNGERVIKEAPLLAEALIIKTNLLDETLSVMPLVDEFQQCPDCEGEGEIECDLGHMHDCEECKDGVTTRVIGKTYKPFDRVKINDCHYDPKHIKLLSKTCEAHNVDFFTVISMAPNRALMAQVKDSIVLIMPTMHDEEKNTVYDIYKETNTQKASN
jgi:hypothetical protein